MSLGTADYVSDLSQVEIKFNLQALRDNVNGKHNMGELLLGKNGKLVHINSKVWQTGANNILPDAEQNYAVRKAICQVLRGGYDEGNTAVRMVQEYLLDAENAGLPLSRDEARKLLELCDSNAQLDEDQIAAKLDLIKKFAEMKREGRVLEFRAELQRADPHDDISNWVKGLRVVSADSWTKIGKTKYNSVISQTASQEQAVERQEKMKGAYDVIDRFLRPLESLESEAVTDRETFITALKGVYEELRGDGQAKYKDKYLEKGNFDDENFRKEYVAALKKHVKNRLVDDARKWSDYRYSSDGDWDEWSGKHGGDVKTHLHDAVYRVFSQCTTVDEIRARQLRAEADD